MEGRMVSHPDGRRARRHSLAVCSRLLAWLALAAVFCGCSRAVNIRDEPDAGIGGNPTELMPDAAIPAIEDAGLDTDAFLACELREEGDCRGTNDFVCDFDPWAREIARTCLTATGCSTNGWLVVDMGERGCVTGIGMDMPNAEYVACVVEAFGHYRCPCSARRLNHLIGLGNDGCPDAGPIACRSGEFPCPPGYSCVQRVCVADVSAGAPGQ